MHPSASFITLTYHPDHLPENGTLVPEHLSSFMKRVRKNTGLSLRFYGVGEYGDESWRPHYHLAMFGMGKELALIVEKSWQMGAIHCGDLTFASAQYVAGYCTKKLTSRTDPRLSGRYPEFARMSRRPGIGAPAVRTIADALSNKHGWDSINATGDVPGSLMHGGAAYPLGPYLRRKLRVAMNFEDDRQPEEVVYAQSVEMLAMWKNHVANAKDPALTIKSMVVQLGAQKARQVVTRQKIYGSRGKQL